MINFNTAELNHKFESDIISFSHLLPMIFSKLQREIHVSCSAIIGNRSKLSQIDFISKTDNFW